MLSQKPTINSQKGIISIMMTIVIMIVISLIVVGLAQLSRREQEQTLNAQLSSQAFYAAESGVNDAVAQIQSMTGSIPAKTNCDNDTNYTFSTDISSQFNVSYSCLLIDPSPPQLVQKLSSDSSVLTLENSAGNVNNVTLTWTVGDNQDASDYTNCPSSSEVSNSNVFKPANGSTPWDCPYGVLRIDLVPATNFSRSGLYSNTMSSFIVPSRDSSSSNHNMNSSKGAVYAAADCDNVCEVRFVGMNNSKYFLRASTFYQNSTLIVTGDNGKANFVGSQIVVDATGKAQDVLRRIRVAVDVNGGNQNASVAGALMSGQSVCKRFNVAPDYFQNNPVLLPTNSYNPLCN